MKRRHSFLGLVLGAGVVFVNGCGGGGGGLGLPDGSGNPGGSGVTTTGGIPSTTTGGATTGGTTGGLSSGSRDVLSATGKLYRGTANVTVSDGVSAAPQTYAVGVKVLVDAPVGYRGVMEDNPVHLMILPDTMTVGSGVTATDHRPGQFTLYSTYLQRNGQGSVSAMFPCWSLKQDGGGLTGTLADNHYLTDEVNTVNVPTRIAENTVWPAPTLMGAGARLTGQLDDLRVQLRVEGTVNTRRDMYPFTIELTATR